MASRIASAGSRVAAKANGISRYVLVSAISADPSAGGDDTYSIYRRAKGRADAELEASGLEYTILRPGSLTDDPGTGRVEVGGNLDGGSISRDDVAAVVARRSTTRRPSTAPSMWCPARPPSVGRSPRCRATHRPPYARADSPAVSGHAGAGRHLQVQPLPIRARPRRSRVRKRPRRSRAFIRRVADHIGARPLSRADPRPDGGETPDDSGAFPRLGGAQLETLSAQGERRPTKVGDLLFREGDASYDFFVILEGKVAIVAGYGHEERMIALHGPGRFLGELNLLIGHAVYLTAEVREPGEVLAVPAARLREIVAQDQELSDTILRAFVLRRSILVGLGAGIKLVGSRFGRDSRRLREFVARNRIPHTWLDVEEDEAADALLRDFGVAPADTPVVIRGEEVLRNPTNAELGGRLGLGTAPRSREVCDLAVAGAGPAGLAAAVYGASEGLATVVVEAVATGGQAATSSRIENYLGFPAGISGSELAARAAIQADKFGAAIQVPVEAVGLTERGGYHALRLDDQSELLARTVLVATGARYRKLGVPRITDFEGVGVYHAATEMEAELCGDGPVVVVGGGNAAGQAAVFLAERCGSVHLLIRGDDLSKSMSRYLADQLEREPNIEVRRRTQVRELRGDQVLEGVVVEDGHGARVTLETYALFLMIGAEPNTDWLSGDLALDEDGFVLTGRESPTAAPDALAKIGRAPYVLEASRPGVFAAGDVRRGSIKRVASAVGEGSMAVRVVHQHLLEPSARLRAPVSAAPTGG